MIMLINDSLRFACRCTQPWIQGLKGVDKVQEPGYFTAVPQGGKDAWGMVPDRRWNGEDIELFSTQNHKCKCGWFHSKHS